MPAKPCLGPDGLGCPHNLLVRGDGVSRCSACETDNLRVRKAAGLTGHVGRHIPKSLRAQVIDDQGGRCARCQIHAQDLKLLGEHLEVHHRDGDSRNNARGNLTAYCPTCHHEIEREA